MNAIAQYMMRLVCGGIVVSLVQTVGASSSTGKEMRKLLCGIFMMIIAVSPWSSFKFPILEYDWEDYGIQAQKYSSLGTQHAEESIQSVISQESQAYILDKADKMGLEIQASVTVDPDSLMPDSITVIGEVTPAEKEILSSFLTDDLRIERSAQIWKIQQ